MLHLKRPSTFSESKIFTLIYRYDFAFKRLYAVTLKFIARRQVTELIVNIIFCLIRLSYDIS
jgi:hypothetical protein